VYFEVCISFNYVCDISCFFFVNIFCFFSPYIKPEGFAAFRQPHKQAVPKGVAMHRLLLPAVMASVLGGTLAFHSPAIAAKLGFVNTPDFAAKYTPRFYLYTDCPLWREQLPSRARGGSNGAAQKRRHYRCSTCTET
jgi:hypothetical protein